MSANQCILEVSTALGRELTPDERRAVNASVDKLIQKFNKMGKPDFEKDLMKALSDMTQEMKAAAIIEKRNAVLNVRARVKAYDYLVSTWADDPAEGIKAFFEGSLADRHGARNSLSASTDELAHNYVSGINARLAKAGVLDIAQSGKLDDQIWKAVVEFGKDTPDEKLLASLAKEAVEVGRVFHDYNELMRLEANKAGAWIKKLPGYVARRSHDPVKIAKAGGLTIPTGDKRHMQAWKQFTAERLDWEKSFPDLLPEEYDGVLETLYDRFVNGYHLKLEKQGEPGLKGPQNIGKKLSHDRVLHFKTPEAEFEYHQKFAAGETLFDNITQGAMRMGRDTAMMQRLGPNAESNLDRVLDDLKEHLEKSKSAHLIPKLNSAITYQKKNVLPLLTGDTMGDNIGWVAFNQGLRSMQMLRDLGGAILSAPSDWVFYASTKRYIGERSAGSFFGAMAEGIKFTLGGVGKKITPEQAQFASSLGIMVDSVLSGVARAGADLDVPGRFSSWVEKMFKIQGLTGWQDRMRLGAAMATSHDHASYVGRSFEELPQGTQAFFRQFAVTADDWNLIRKGALEEDIEGRTYLTPESLNALSPEVIDSHPAMANLGKDVSESVRNTAREKLVKELKSRYRAMFTEVGALATSEPQKGDRAFMMRGTKPGTLEGELFRHAWAYKSFTVSVMRKHLGREFHGYHPDRVGIVKATQRLFTDGKGGLQGLASTIAVGSLMGYVSMALKDIRSMKEPRVPQTAEEFRDVFGAALAQSGSVGIYGDFLFGEAKSRLGQGPLETLLGPTWRTGGDIKRLYDKIRAGQDAKADGFRFVLNNTPGVNGAYNLFYTRAALDWLIVHRIQESMNPGYLNRMETNLRNSKNQEYLNPPSNYAGR
jgi:hypothetical protein